MSCDCCGIPFHRILTSRIFAKNISQLNTEIQEWSTVSIERTDSTINCTYCSYNVYTVGAIVLQQDSDFCMIIAEEVINNMRSRCRRDWWNIEHVNRQPSGKQCSVEMLIFYKNPPPNKTAYENVDQCGTRTYHNPSNSLARLWNVVVYLQNRWPLIVLIVYRTTWREKREANAQFYACTVYIRSTLEQVDVSKRIRK